MHLEGLLKLRLCSLMILNIIKRIQIQVKIAGEQFVIGNGFENKK